MEGLIDMIVGKRKKDDLGKTEAVAGQAKMANEMGYSKVEPSEKTKSKKRVLDAIKSGKKLSPDDASTYANSLAGKNK